MAIFLSNIETYELHDAFTAARPGRGRDRILREIITRINGDNYDSHRAASIAIDLIAQPHYGATTQHKKDLFRALCAKKGDRYGYSGRGKKHYVMQILGAVNIEDEITALAMREVSDGKDLGWQEAFSLVKNENKSKGSVIGWAGRRLLEIIRNSSMNFEAMPFLAQALVKKEFAEGPIAQDVYKALCDKVEREPVETLAFFKEHFFRKLDMPFEPYKILERAFIHAPERAQNMAREILLSRSTPWTDVSFLIDIVERRGAGFTLDEAGRLLDEATSDSHPALPRLKNIFASACRKDSAKTLSKCADLLVRTNNRSKGVMSFLADCFCEAAGEHKGQGFVLANRLLVNNDQSLSTEVKDRLHAWALTALQSDDPAVVYAWAEIIAPYKGAPDAAVMVEMLKADPAFAAFGKPGVL